MAAVTVDTSTIAQPLRWSSQRRLDSCQGGVLWLVHYSGTAFEFWYSTDDGASWAQDSGATITPTSGTEASIDLFIDLDDYIHVLWQDTSSGTSGLTYRRGTLDAAKTTITWGTATAVEVQGGGSPGMAGRASVVAFRKPSGVGWFVAVFGEFSTGTDVRLGVAGLDAAGAFEDNPEFATFALTTGFASGAGSTMAPCLDFNHTGDGKTVANNSPHLYVVYSDPNSAIRFRKMVWTGSTWTANADRSLDSSNHADGTAGLLSAAFDGSRMVAVYRPSGSTSTLAWVERDAGDTTTTSRTPTALSDGVVQSVSLGIAKSGDAYLLASGATSLDPKWSKFTRSTTSFGSWTAIEATDTRPNSASWQRVYSRLWLRCAFARGTASPYDVRFDRTIGVSTAPSASTWAAPSDNQAADVAESLVLDWTFVDVDSGDSQSAYALRRQIGAAAYDYWNAGTSSWGASETKNTSATSSVTLASGWGADGDANHKYAVKTWDSVDLEGTYSAELTVIPSAQDNPTIDTPADAGTVTVATLTTTWTVTTQTAYLAELLNSGGTTVLESSGWTTSATASHTFAYVLVNGTSYRVRVTTKNDEGLASDADTNTFSVSFTPPATPTLVVTGGTPTGAIRVAVTNGAGPPATTSVSIYRREGSDASTEIRKQAGLGSSPTWDDYEVNSGVTYQYQAVGYAASGATAASAWTA